MGLIFKRVLTQSDFKVHRRYYLFSRREAFDLVKGLNASAETVDAPYLPIRAYSTVSGPRRLVWKQDFGPA